jgi:hypothetical protein
MRSHPNLPARWLTPAALLACLLIAAQAARPGAGGPAGKRRPVPGKAAQAEARKVIDDIFKEDIANAKDAASRVKLAQKLLSEARESKKDDPPAAYVLYRQALDLATAAGDYTLGFQNIDELTAEFDLPALDLKANALAAAAPAVTGEEANKALTDVTLRLLADAVDADDYASAAKLGEVALAAAKKARSVALFNAVRKRTDAALAARKTFEGLRPFLERLKKDPADAEANLKVGEHFGLFKGKWERALPYLAKGSHEGLKEQARQDLAQPKDGRGQLTVADGWWELAPKFEGPGHTQMLLRARHWYEQAALNLTGLNRTKAVRRMEKIAALTGGPAPVVKPEGPVGAVRTFQGHTDDVRGVAFSPDGRYALSGSRDKTARIWDLTTGKPSRVLKGHDKEVWDVAYHPNGRELFTASWDGTVKRWDAGTGMEIRKYVHPLDVNSVVISRDGRWMLTGCDDKNMRLWDLTTHQEVRSYRGGEKFIYGVAFSPDGRYLASGSEDRTVRVYEKQTAKKVREINAQTAEVYYVAFSQDSRFVFSCGDEAAHLWEIANGKEARKYMAGGNNNARAMALSPDGRRLLTGHDDRTVRLWDVASGKEIRRFEGHTATVSCVAFSHDGARALSGSQDNTVRLWNLPPP